MGHDGEGGGTRQAGHKPWVSYRPGGCAWYKAAAYREQVRFMEIEDMSMGVRGVSVGTATDAPEPALVVVVRQQL